MCRGHSGQSQEFHIKMNTKNYVNVKNKLKNVMEKNITKMARLKDVMRMNIKQAQNSATNKSANCRMLCEKSSRFKITMSQ
jgi:hypothetical protein